jgi:hypothetical protein
MADDVVIPLDVVLALANLAHTREARHILRDIREEIATGGDAASWARAVQVARDLGAIDPDAAFFLLGIVAEDTLLRRTGDDPTLVELTTAMEAIERREGLTEDEAFFVDDAPEDWAALNRRWEARARIIQAEFLRAVGEPAMAAQLQLRTAAYDARSRDGWRALLSISGEVDPFVDSAGNPMP